MLQFILSSLDTILPLRVTLLCLLCHFARLLRRRRNDQLHLHILNLLWCFWNLIWVSCSDFGARGNSVGCTGNFSLEFEEIWRLRLVQILQLFGFTFQGSCCLCRLCRHLGVSTWLAVTATVLGRDALTIIKWQLYHWLVTWWQCRLILQRKKIIKMLLTVCNCSSISSCNNILIIIMLGDGFCWIDKLSLHILVFHPTFMYFEKWQFAFVI